MAVQSEHWDRWLRLHGPHLSPHGLVLCDMLQSEADEPPEVSYRIRGAAGWLGNEPKQNWQGTTRPKWVDKPLSARIFRTPGRAEQAWRAAKKAVADDETLQIVLFLQVASGHYAPWDFKT